MNSLLLATGKVLCAGAALLVCSGAGDAKKPMSFFVTSAGPGDGANLGGLAGADAHCAKLAKAAGSIKANWRAYLSTTQEPNGPAPVDARSRIGRGPWVNAAGVTIAKSIEDLHDSRNRMLTKANFLTEKGAVVNGAGDTPNRHDILTGSDTAGRYLGPGIGADTTCGNWTKNGEGSAVVGHHDGKGPNGNRNFTSWNSAHASSGCGQPMLEKTGGSGLFYCFEAS